MHHACSKRRLGSLTTGQEVGDADADVGVDNQLLHQFWLFHWILVVGGLSEAAGKYPALLDRRGPSLPGDDFAGEEGMSSPPRPAALQPL